MSSDNNDFSIKCTHQCKLYHTGSSKKIYFIQLFSVAFQTLCSELVFALLNKKNKKIQQIRKIQFISCSNFAFGDKFVDQKYQQQLFQKVHFSDTIAKLGGTWPRQPRRLLLNRSPWFFWNEKGHTEKLYEVNFF